MRISKNLFLQEQISIVKFLFKWTVLSIPLAVLVGSLVALFLWVLDIVTRTRQANMSLIFTLPLTGIIIHFLYKLWGKSAERGNNLLMDEIHEPGTGVPGRMTPLVLVSTWLTHLSGGSVGREGTAVQMGGSLAALVAKWTRINEADRRIMLMMGIAGGFSAVFDTPLAGTVFALEVLAIGVIRYYALLPCFIAALFSNLVTRAWGIRHTQYTIKSAIPNLAYSFGHIDMVFVAKTILAGIAFGLAARLFAGLSHGLTKVTTAYIKPLWLIPVMAGIVIMAIVLLVPGAVDYIGLGDTNPRPGGVSIASSFHANGATYYSWLWKLLLTALTLGCGFKGGEVTPLFFIGATLGNAFAIASGAPIDLFAALGFIAVFAGATNTPLACTLMGVELFGGTHVFYYAVACFTAYYFSGHSGIYSAQRIEVNKVGGLPEE